MKGIAKLSSGAGVVGSLAALSTCGMLLGVAGVTGGVLLLSGGLLHGKSSTLRFLLALVSHVEACGC